MKFLSSFVVCAIGFIYLGIVFQWLGSFVDLPITTTATLVGWCLAELKNSYEEYLPKAQDKLEITLLVVSDLIMSTISFSIVCGLYALLNYLT